MKSAGQMNSLPIRSSSSLWSLRQRSFNVSLLLGSLFAMASFLSTAMPAADVELNLKLISAELSFLLTKEGIPDEIQAKLASLGYSDTAVFSKMEDTPKEVREVLTKDVGIDPTASPQHRAAHAKVLVAWEHAKKRVEARIQEESSQRVTDAPRVLTKGLHHELIKAFEKIHGERTDKQYPAPPYIEAKLEQVETGELRAETLAEVLNREDHCQPPPKLVVSPSGEFTFRPGECKGTAPSKPEELRRVFRVMGTCWEFIRLRVPSKPYLKDYDIAIWDAHVEWLLGEEVFDFQVKDDKQVTIYKPGWQQVLILDYNVRKLAYKMVIRDGYTIKEAMARAREDEKVFRKHFTLPISLAAASTATAGDGARPSRDHDRRSRSPRQGQMEVYRPSPQKGKGKGNSKRKAGHNKKGKGKMSAADHDRGKTPDGREKCFAFNRDSCHNAACQRVHVCLHCNGPHPRSKCPTAPPMPGGKGK